MKSSVASFNNDVHSSIRTPFMDAEIMPNKLHVDSRPSLDIHHLIVNWNLKGATTNSYPYLWTLCLNMTLLHHRLPPPFNGKFLSRESTVTWPARGNIWACSWNYTSLYKSRDYKIDEIKRNMDKTEHFCKMDRTGRQTSLSPSVSLDWIIPWAF